MFVLLDKVVSLKICVSFCPIKKDVLFNLLCFDLALFHNFLLNVDASRIDKCDLI